MNNYQAGMSVVQAKATVNLVWDRVLVADALGAEVSEDDSEQSRTHCQ